MNHFFQTIPGWFSFRPLYERMVREAPNPAHFVEVGCWKGRSAAFMAVEIVNSGKKIRFDCVDTWKGSEEPKHLADKSVKNGTLFEDFLGNVAPVRRLGLLRILRATSVQAAEHYYSDEQLDFVFIDAAHDYENVKADIAAWWPKIRPGGTLAGDDFKFKGVNRAVNEFFIRKTEGFEALTRNGWQSFAPRKDMIEEVPGTGTGCAWLVRKS